jgi:ATP-dependent Zn protease
MLSEAKEQKGLGDEIYSGAASFGVLYSLIGAVVATIIGIIMIGIGIYLLTRKVEYETINATIINLSCRPLKDNNQICNINVSYNYNNKDENKYINYTGNNVFMVNQKVLLYINKQNINDISLDEPTPKWVGILLSVLGLIIILSGWFWYWASKNYKFVGAAAGVGGFINIINPHKSF